MPVQRAKFRVVEYSREALGRVIRDLREAHAPKLSQEELGRNAGYRTGAGVSMSRIESGQTRPSRRRLEGIAGALGLPVEELEIRSAQRTAQPDSPAPPGSPGTHRESTKERMRRIQREFDRRQTQAVTLGRAFNAAHDRARDDYFLELVASARTVIGLPTAPLSSRAAVADRAHPAAEVGLRHQVAAGAITAVLASGAGAVAAANESDAEAAYGAVVAAALLTPVPFERADSDPPREATARATRALLGSGPTIGGRTGITAAVVLLSGFVAAAASPLVAAGTLAWFARRSRQQNDQLRMELDQAESNLTVTQSGFDAVMRLLSEATRLLDYVAVHAAHAQRRWRAILPVSPTPWPDLSPDQQRQYAAFVDVAAWQVCVDSINMTELLAAPAEQQSALIHAADDVLTVARHELETLV